MTRSIARSPALLVAALATFGVAPGARASDPELARAKRSAQRACA